MSRDRNPNRAPASPTRALREFLATEASGGILLLAATAVALVWANAPFRASYTRVWQTELGPLDLHHWVNDGLMAVFFFVVGLEVKRELVHGELRDPRRAALPVAGAVGGMVVPALIYSAVNIGGGGAAGWGVQMATDIAFAIGVLAVVAPGIPASVRLFLLTLAIVDDIGAIVVIALFYSDGLEWRWLGTSFGIVLAVAVVRRTGMARLPVFAALGVGLWVTVHEAGVHATLAGVAMGLLVPASERVEQRAHALSAFAIIPVFALANAGVALSGSAIGDAATSKITLGVMAGLVVGKPLGITAVAWLATRLRMADLPDDTGWRQIVGVATLAGIGFTVSLFIAGLAFDDGARVTDAKVGILAASLLASVVGAIMFRHGHGQGVPADPVHGTSGGD